MQEPIKQLSGVPALITLHEIIPLEYPELPLAAVTGASCMKSCTTRAMLHPIWITNKQDFDYLYNLRAGTIQAYARSRGEKAVPNPSGKTPSEGPLPPARDSRMRSPSKYGPKIPRRRFGCDVEITELIQKPIAPAP